MMTARSAGTRPAIANSLSGSHSRISAIFRSLFSAGGEACAYRDRAGDVLFIDARAMGRSACFWHAAESREDATEAAPAEPPTAPPPDEKQR